MRKFLLCASAIALMFSSCTKEASELTPQVGGQPVFSASINVEDEASTRLELDGKYYKWNVNDAIGVASAQAVDANIMVSNTQEGDKPTFSVAALDYDRWLSTSKEAALFVYFPHREGVAFDAEGNVELTIPAKQRFQEGTFYKNTVNAVGYVEKYTGADQAIKLTIPTSLIRVHVVGLGNTGDQISLQIKNANDKFYKLNGDAKVNVTDEKPTFKFTTVVGEENVIETVAENDEASKVTVTFGFKPENLKFNEEIDVHFVVPAGLDLSGAELIFTSGSSKFVKTMATAPTGSSRVLVANQRVTITDMIQFNLEKKFLVVADENGYSAEEKFLAYAYLTRPNVVAEYFANPVDVKADFDYAATKFNMNDDLTNGGLNTEAWIIPTSLDFAAYDEDWAVAKYNAYVDALSHLDTKDGEAAAAKKAEYTFWMNVCEWYKNNGCAIESLSYNAVIGANYGQSANCNVATTIKNLNVKGDGISAGASLKNLVFEGVTVNVPAGATQAGLIAGANDLKSTVLNGTEKAMVIENVTISTGNTVNVNVDGVTYVGGIYGFARKAEVNPVKANKSVNIVLTKIPTYVGRLFGEVLNSVELKVADNYNWLVNEKSDYYVIGSIGKGANVTFDVVVDSEKYNGGIVKRTAVHTGYTMIKTPVISTYYWNGRVADGVDADGIFTPEELAYVVSNGKGVKTVELTHHIDMQNFELAIGNKTSITAVDGNAGAPRTIKNVNGVQADNNKTNVSLFGKNAKGCAISNVLFENINIATNGETTYSSVSGLAYSGTVTNVKVKDLTITAHQVKNVKAIGSVFVEATPASFVGPRAVSVENVTINNFEGTTAGAIAASLTLTGSKATLSGINVFGTFKVTEKSNMTKAAAKNLDTYINGTPAAYSSTNTTTPFGALFVDSAEFSATQTGGYYDFTVSDCTYGERIAARYWFPETFLSGAKSVTTDSTKSYDYAFKTNANQGNSSYANHIGFTK